MPRTRHDIVLATLNARYIHTAFGLRYLYANLGALRDRAVIAEFTINQQPADIVEQLLAHTPRIVALGVYIWNVAETEAVVTLLRTVAPEVVIVVGGPEVSHPPDLPALASRVDHIVTGPGEHTLPELCRQILEGNAPARRIVPGLPVPLEQLELPYRDYTDEDIRHRIVYVEASRGCPFKCEFCLSSLDKTAKPFPLPRFLDEMARLLERGARHFKFIDRTFNLRVDSSVAILTFFLQRLSDDLYLHFEVVPDNLPDPLKAVLQRFPPGVLQFEVGVQSFDPVIQQRINRRQNNDRTRANLRWLRRHTGAHIHADLIFGLPGDTLENFAASFDELVALGPQEIQLGILKRLRGAPLERHTEPFGMRYNPLPPYNVLATADLDFATIQRMNRFARHWDLIGNSGHFHHTLPLLLETAPFHRFLRLSDTLYETTRATTGIALRRLFLLLAQVVPEALEIDTTELTDALHRDWNASPLKGEPPFRSAAETTLAHNNPLSANRRQRRHLPATGKERHS